MGAKAANYPSKMMRLIRAAVAVLSALLLAGPLAMSARTAEVQMCPNIQVHEDWATIAAPAFTGSAGPDIVTYAVHPRDPSYILVTNGEQIFETENGGCNWEPFSFSLDLLPGPDRPVSSATATVTDIDIPEHPSAADRVFITVEEGLRGAAVRPHVFVKTGGTTEWRSAIQGLPPAVGGVYGLHVAPSDPDIVYLHVRKDPATLSDSIYASLDGGQSWQERSKGGATASSAIAVDPLLADEVWSWGATGLWHSGDGGRSFSKINAVPDGVGPVDVFHAPNRPTQIMVYEPETFSFSISRDGGASWERFMGPGGGVALSIAHGNDVDDIVFAQHARVDRFKPPSYWAHITPTDYKQPDLHKLSADRTAQPSIFGMTPRTIERYLGLNETVSLPGFEGDIDAPVVTDNTSLQPSETTVTLKAGKSKDVPYRFALPANPTPLDVFFLVDTTSSMESSIAGLRHGMQSIVNDLAASNINVQFGVGEVKDYPIPGFGDPTTGDFPYILRRAIGPADESLADALEQLEASGGGKGDYEEAQLSGLYYALNEEGEPGCTTAPTEEAQSCVPPNQDAGFRHDSLPVIVNITDFGFHDEPSHPSPTFDAVAQELRLERAKQIGLAVFGTQGWTRATTDLRAMAEATDTRSPAGGVDCDGNGSPDVAEGEPLVCQLGDMDGSGVLNIAPSIVATVKAVAEEVTVELVTSDDKVIDVDRNLYPSVDVTEQNSLGFGVTFTCPRALAGTKHHLKLAAHVQGQPVATASAKVVCKGIPAAVLAKREKEPPAPPPVMPVFPPAAVAIPAIAPAGPPPIPETISSTQSAAQAQGAIAKQEQEQVQVAVAMAEFKNSEAYALSAYTERQGPSPAPLYLSAVLMSLGAGFFALTRNRIRTAPSRRR